MKPAMALAVLMVTAVMSACDGVADPSDPTIPELIAPAQGAILDNGCLDQSDAIIWDFDWSDVQHATEYYLVVSGPNAIYPLIDRVAGESGFHYEQVAYIIPRHQPGWRWRVRARIGEDWMEWTEERTFDVEPLNSDCL